MVHSMFNIYIEKKNHFLMCSLAKFMEKLSAQNKYSYNDPTFILRSSFAAPGAWNYYRKKKSFWSFFYVCSINFYVEFFLFISIS